MNIVLLLNSDYTPLNVIDLRRGFKLLYNGKADVLHTYDTPIMSGVKTYDRPKIIKLKSYVRLTLKTFKVNRIRIYKRDGYECVYCGSGKNLTIDHVIPKSKGGKNEWTNLVTCCYDCNHYKADRTPEQANMVLYKKPYAPTLFTRSMNSNVDEMWEEYCNLMQRV